MTDRNPRVFYLTMNGRQCTGDRPEQWTRDFARILRLQFPTARIEMFEFDASVGYGRPVAA